MRGRCEQLPVRRFDVDVLESPIMHWGAPERFVRLDVHEQLYAGANFLRLRGPRDVRTRQQRLLCLRRAGSVRQPASDVHRDRRLRGLHVQRHPPLHHHRQGVCERQRSGDLLHRFARVRVRIGEYDLHRRLLFRRMHLLHSGVRSEGPRRIDGKLAGGRNQSARSPESPQSARQYPVLLQLHRYRAGRGDLYGSASVSIHVVHVQRRRDLLPYERR
jgi:hypothetical protein